MYDETDFMDLNDLPDDRRTTKQILSQAVRESLDYWYQGGEWLIQEDDYQDSGCDKK